MAPAAGEARLIRPAAGRVAVVLKGYPRLSETFVAQEILGLERRGVDVLIFSLRHPTDPSSHDLHRAIQAPVAYLPEYLHQEVRRVAEGVWRARRLPGFAAAMRAFRNDLARDRTRNRIRRFGQACVLAAELPDDVDRLYAHFLHTPASVARYVALMTGLPLAISAHAKDIWTTPAWDKRDKLQLARWTTTCTRDGAEHLRELAPTAEVLLVHHGVDLARFAPFERSAGPDGSDPQRPVRLLCVARAVEKKALDLLIDALAALPREVAWSLEHIGGGPLVTSLRERARRAGIERRVTWRGPQPHQAVLDAYRRADLFVLPLRTARDGDRDGLPNVLVEAQSQDLAVVTSTAGSTRELVRDGLNGRLVPPDDASALTAALRELIADPELRLRMGRAGRRIVARGFAASAGLDRLAARLATPALAREPA